MPLSLFPFLHPSHFLTLPHSQVTKYMSLFDVGSDPVLVELKLTFLHDLIDCEYYVDLCAPRPIEAAKFADGDTEIMDGIK